MTLFALATSWGSLFHLALEKYFCGQMDMKTVEILKLNQELP
jgi:uncharacterized protein (DUF1810 family)